MRADGSIDWDRWLELPILTRADAQDNFAALRARSLPPAAGRVERGYLVRLDRPAPPAFDDATSRTSRPAAPASGSSGGMASTRVALTVRIRAVKHPDAAYPKGRRTIGWRAGHEDSEAIDLSIATQVGDQIEWLQRVRPRISPAIRAICAKLRERQRAPAVKLRFDAIMTFGEMTSDDMRVAIEDYFGLPPLDRYGSSEVGQISATCPHSLKHHVTSELVLLEIVDADGYACRRRARSAE